MPTLGLGLGLVKRVRPLFRGLLDKFDGAAAAYSLRKLSASTTNVVRVRRSSDDTEQDFTAAQVSDGSLVDFANNGTSDLYGERMYFDGTDDYVALNSAITLSGDFSISFSVLFDSIGNPTSNGIMGNSNCKMGLTTGTTFILTNNAGADGSITLSETLTTGVIYNLTLERTSNELTLKKDGVDISSSKPTLAGDIVIDTLGVGRNRDFQGLLFDVDINSVASYQGYGNTNADWEDQIGSNDGTVNGSPALYSGQGFDGFVTTWYDQSGTSRNATQAFAPSQPQIVDSGALVTGGIDFDGVDDYLEFLGTLRVCDDTSGAWFASSVLTYDNTPGAAVSFASDDNTGTERIGQFISQNFGDSRTIGSTVGGSLTTDIGPSLSSGVEYLQTGLLDGTDIECFLNGSTNGSTIFSGSPNTNETDRISLGARRSATATTGQLNGKIKEAILFPFDQSANRTAIESNIAAYHGITLA